MLRRATRIQREVQITAVDGDGLLHIVVEKPSILEQETMDAQLKQGVFPVLFGRSRPFRCRHVARAIFAHEDMHVRDRKSTRLNSSHGYISYAVFCLKKKNIDRAHT